MKTKLIEAHTCSKRGEAFPDLNDDGLVEGNWAVIDGVSGADGRDFMQMVKTLTEQRPREMTEKAFRHAVATAASARYGLPQLGKRMPGAAFAGLSEYYDEVWVYADPFVAFLDNTGQWTRHEFVLPGMREAAVTRQRINTAYKYAHGLADWDFLYKKDEGSEALGHMHDIQFGLANTEHPLGYTVLCAKPVPDSMAKRISVPANVVEIVFMSDGYPTHLMDDADIASLAAAEAKRKAVIEADPHCMDANLGVKGLMVDKTTGRMNENNDDFSYMRLRVI